VKEVGSADRAEVSRAEGRRFDGGETWSSG
jgi:hypothetical protein